MRINAGHIIVLLGLTATACVAQQWELGVTGGYGFYKNATVKNATGSGTVGVKSGLAAGAFAGNEMYERVSGEMRYLYRAGVFKVSGGGQQAEFDGETHVIHFDLLYHFADRESRIRPFLAGGGGIKVYRGVGTEVAFQPANRFALLTQAQETRPLISAGGGVKVALNERVHLRLEFRDYMTPFPREVVAAAPGATIQGWLHDFVPTAGIGFLF